ncbi:ribosomal protein [Lithospermum erythrorhizon]|uniref:Large ribosomal subunit protein uL29m n=1 Tax=Lithospermum erythrorhizon TaxID=34254 RepID=A0AAV3RE84_LITER
MSMIRALGRTLFAAAKTDTSASASAAGASMGRIAQNPLEEFFEVDRTMEAEKPVVYGRGWKASELRLKSWDDLNKLWYVLLKEKNMLMTQKQILDSRNLRFPNPEQYLKKRRPLEDDDILASHMVRKSMCRIKHVLTERAIDEPDPRRSAEMKRMINSL